MTSAPRGAPSTRPPAALVRSRSAWNVWSGCISRPASLAALTLLLATHPGESSPRSANPDLDGDGLVDENAPATVEAFPEGPGSETGRAAEGSSLLRDAAALLAGSSQGIDTAALLAGIQEKARWGELPDRLLEAQGILLWNKGEARLGLACLRRLAKPSPASIGILGEGALLEGDRYEAAALFLKGARAYPAADDRAPALYRRHLSLNPDAAVEAELAARLEKLGRYGEAAPIRVKDPARAAATPAEALGVGAMLASQGHADEALALYRLAIARHPADKALRARLAAACEAEGRRLEAGRAYADVFALDPAETAARDRALAHLEASGAAAEAPLRALLETAVERDGSDPRLRFKLAVSCLAAGDRAGAHAHLSKALKSDPNNPTWLARLPETLEGDSLIKAHSAFLRKVFEQRGGSARLVELAARSYALEGRQAEAARAWFQLHAMAPHALDGRRDAVMALASTGDPAYLSIAGRLAAPLAEKSPGDRDVALLLLKAQVQDGRHDQASLQARRLLKAFPAEEEAALAALAAAKAMLSMEKPEPAQAVLADLVAVHPSPEASLLLGGLLQGAKECAAALDHLEVAAVSFPVALRMQGECLEMLKEPLRASLAYQAYYARTQDKEGLLAMARVNRTLGDPDREKEGLETLVAKGLAKEDDRLRLGLAHASTGDSARAAGIFEALFKARTQVPAEPAWVDAGILLGSRLAAEGKPDRAIRALSIALRADANRPEAWRLLGDCQVARRLWKPAAASYAAAEAAGHSDAALARAQLEVAVKLGSRKDMAKAYGHLLRHEPSHAEAQAFLAAWHRAERNYLDAAQFYRLRLEEHPGDARAWEALGHCLALSHDLAAAGEPLQKAIDLGAGSDEVYVNRARAYRHEGAMSMAASILEFLLSRDERSYLALVWSAKFAEQDGRPDAAMELFKRASRLDPPKTEWPELASQGVAAAAVGAARTVRPASP